MVLPAEPVVNSCGRRKDAIRPSHLTGRLSDEMFHVWKTDFASAVLGETTMLQRLPPEPLCWVPGCASTATAEQAAKRYALVVRLINAAVNA